MLKPRLMPGILARIRWREPLSVSSPSLVDRRKPRPLVLLAVAAIVVCACGLIDETRPTVPVTVFGRSATPPEVWVAVWPMTDPAAAVGFGVDAGVACLDAPIGSEVVVLNGPPGLLSTVVRVVTEVRPPANEDQQAAWADVAANGTVLTGERTPGWWTDSHRPC
jgi:hypothetical protein